MKKSGIYHMAMMVIVNTVTINAEDKLEILKQLMDDKALAEWSEKQEEAK